MLMSSVTLKKIVTASHREYMHIDMCQYVVLIVLSLATINTGCIFFISRGSLFHSIGAAEVKDHSPYDFFLKIGGLLKRC